MLDDETLAGAQSDADQLMERLFYGKTSPYRGYSPLGPVSVIVPGQMFRAQMFRVGDDSDRFEVTVYQGVTGFVNEGEVEAVDDIVTSMHPEATAVDADDRNSLAVLTPYHRQRELLRKRPRLKDSVFTVHSFQGREAHRVIVSLVRDQRVADNPARNVGLLAQDEVINVLLSRARSLLVLVGNFRHFEENAGPAWHWVTRIIEHYGRRVDASEVKDWTLE